eukprot:12265043-Heterocapsa_arctica.AAC.1
MESIFRVMCLYSKLSAVADPESSKYPLKTLECVIWHWVRFHGPLLTIRFGNNPATPCRLCVTEVGVANIGGPLVQGYVPYEPADCYEAQ